MMPSFDTPPPAPATAARPLTHADAVDIWIARWLKVRRRDLLKRYGCDPRRLYEIWQEDRFPGSRDAALAVLRDRYPFLTDRIDPGPHTRLSKAPHPDQLQLFE